MTDPISYGSLCTGYDGLGDALRLAGVRIAPQWMAEVDEAMSLVLKHEHPDVPNVGDVKTAPWHLAPHTDLMSSGDPCQSISIAGRKAGRDDPRFLWPWVRAAYRSVRPGAIFFENVANIVSHDGGRTLAERFAHLREDGYAVRWTVLGACAVGAPHHRHRWYAVAAYVGAGAPGAVRIGTKQLCGAPRSGGRYVLPSPMARDADSRGEGSPGYWATRSERRNNGAPLGAIVNLLPTPDASMSTRGGFLSPAMALKRIADVQRSSNLDDVIASLLPTPMSERSGNNRGGAAGRADQPVRPSLDSVSALLPTPIVSDATSGPGRTANREGTDDLRTAVTLLPTPRASDGEKGRGNPGQVYGSGTLPLSGAIARMLPTPTVSNSQGNQYNNKGDLLLPGIAVRPEVWGKYAEAVALWEYVIGVPAPEPTEISPKGSRRLNPQLPEWMMGLRPGLLTDRLDRADALKGAGNGVVALAAAAAWRLLTES